MTLDASLRKQLIEARKRIIAQLDENTFRVIGLGTPHGGAGPSDYDSLSAQLLKELREIDRLLDPNADANPD